MSAVNAPLRAIVASLSKQSRKIVEHRIDSLLATGAIEAIEIDTADTPQVEEILANWRTLKTELGTFFHDRLKVYLKDKGRRYDAIDAVLARSDGSLEDDLVLIVMKLEALEVFLKTDDGANLAAGFKRAANILRAEEKKGAAAGAAAADPSKLQQAEEKALYAALVAAQDRARAAVANEKFADAMAALSTLRAPIDAFFNKVTVNADDKALRANRLALLQNFVAATATVADLSKLEG